MKTTTCTALAALLTIGAANAATIQYIFTSDTGADFSSYITGPGPITIQDITATVDGVDFTFDLTLSGTVGTAAGGTEAGLVFTAQRVRFDFTPTDTDNKTLTVSISDIQGGVTFDGFTAVDRFDNGGGDPWDVNGETISNVGNAVSLATPITDPMVITQLDGNAGATRFEGFTASFTKVPEPSTTALLGLAGLAMILRRRK